jgi:hypothetical protein
MKKEHESIFVLQVTSGRGGYWCRDTLFPVMNVNEATLFTTRTEAYKIMKENNLEKYLKIVEVK